MATYLSANFFKNLPSLNTNAVGWNDDKGYALKNVAVTASDRYYLDMKTASNYADSFHQKLKEVDSFLSHDEPRLKSL